MVRRRLTFSLEEAVSVRPAFQGRVRTAPKGLQHSSMRPLLLARTRICDVGFFGPGATLNYLAIGNGGQTRSAPYIDPVALKGPYAGSVPLRGEKSRG